VFANAATSRRRFQRTRGYALKPPPMTGGCWHRKPTRYQCVFRPQGNLSMGPNGLDFSGCKQFFSATLGRATWPDQSRDGLGPDCFKPTPSRLPLKTMAGPPAALIHPRSLCFLAAWPCPTTLLRTPTLAHQTGSSPIRSYGAQATNLSPARAKPEADYGFESAVKRVGCAC